MLSSSASLKLQLSASVSVSKSCEGKAYLYDQIALTVRKYFQNHRTITRIYIYESPLSALQGARETSHTVHSLVSNFLPKVHVAYAGVLIANEVVKHHEIILQIEQLAYVLFSFGQDGLQSACTIQLQHLVSRRNNNVKVKQIETRIDGIKIKEFLKMNQSKNYHLTQWNCQDYCKALLKALQLQ